jgi:hypothetical protein
MVSQSPFLIQTSLRWFWSNISEIPPMGHYRALGHLQFSPDSNLTAILLPSLSWTRLSWKIWLNQWSRSDRWSKS